MRKGTITERFQSPIPSEENLTGLRASISTMLGTKKLPIDSHEWESYFDESGQLCKSRDYVADQILERGLDPSIKPEVWKFLTGYYSWSSTWDERLMVDSRKRKSYESLCNLCEKIQPLLETEHRGFMEIQNLIKSDVQRLYVKDAQGNTLVDKSQLEKILLLNYVCNVGAEYQQGFHEMLLLFWLLADKEHEIYWLFQFFLQKTENSCIMNVGVEKNLVMLTAFIEVMDPVLARHFEGKGQVVESLFSWFCLFFQRLFRSFDDVWRLWERNRTRDEKGLWFDPPGTPGRLLNIILHFDDLPAFNAEKRLLFSQAERHYALKHPEGIMLCNNIIDLDAEELIAKACVTYELFLRHKEKVPKELKEFFSQP